MDKFAPSSTDRTEAAGNPRFTTQAATAEDLLKAQTVGLVNLNDYRKRRAEALDRKERGESAISSGATTPLDGLVTSSALGTIQANLPSTEVRRPNLSSRRSARLPVKANSLLA